MNVFTNSGGSLPYTWSVISGQLPPGMYLASDISFSQTGDDITGTPRTTGTYTFTMQVTDGAGNKASKRFANAAASTAWPQGRGRAAVTTQSRTLPGQADGYAWPGGPLGSAHR
ncbi:MAG TPA: Ig domain-containing protein [Streptosporangiaceae bacterium]|nr:Ig domain-containing protein [Streptosporangiaceae bacterium]